MLTASTSDSARAHGLALGAADYMTRPLAFKRARRASTRPRQLTTPGRLAAQRDGPNGWRSPPTLFHRRHHRPRITKGELDALARDLLPSITRRRQRPDRSLVGGVVCGEDFGRDATSISELGIPIGSSPFPDLRGLASTTPRLRRGSATPARLAAA